MEKEVSFLDRYVHPLPTRPPHGQAVCRGSQGSHLARRYPRMPEHPPCKALPEDAGAPTGSLASPSPGRRHPGVPRRPRASGLPRMPRLLPCKPVVEDALRSDRWPWPPSHGRGHRGVLGHLEGRRGASGSLEPLGGLGRQGVLGGLGDLGCQGVLGDLGDQGVLGVLGVDGERRDPWTPWAPWRHWRPWTPRCPWSPGCPWRPWTPRDPRGRRGASEGPGAYNCKNGFQNMFLNHRFRKKSRKSYQNFRNNSKSQTMKSAQDFFYRFWDRAIMTQSIIAVFANRGGTSAQYRTKKVSHN